MVHVLIVQCYGHDSLFWSEKKSLQLHPVPVLLLCTRPRDNRMYNGSISTRSNPQASHSSSHTLCLVEFMDELGGSMSTMVVQELLLWLNNSEMKLTKKLTK